MEFFSLFAGNMVVKSFPHAQTLLSGMYGWLNALGIKETVIAPHR